jgi:hypothetical protein
MPEVNLNETSNDARLSFNLPRDLHKRLKDVCPHGVQSTLLRKLVEVAVKRIEKGGAPVIGAIICGDYDPFQKGG